MTNHPISEVTTAILSKLTPRALKPPSAKRRDCMTTTIEIQIIPRLGPSTITAHAPPRR